MSSKTTVLFVLILAAAVSFAQPASLTYPANGSTLGASQTFAWTMNSATAPVYFHVGSTVGGVDIVNIGPLTGSSVTVNLPTDGKPVYAQITSVVHGRMGSNSYSFMDGSGAAALSWPSNGSILGASQTFAWTMNSAAAPVYLHVGSTVGGVDLVNMGPLTGSSITVGLPTDGKPAYATISSAVNGSTESNSYSYVDGSGAATLTWPTGGSTLGVSQTFAWTMNAATAPVYFHVGSTVGGVDVVNIGPLSGNSVSVNLPGGVSPLYVTLTSTVNGSTMSNFYSFMDSSGAAALTYPANGSTLGASQAFAWTMNSATAPVYLHVGSTVGGLNIVNIGPLTGSSVTVNLPTDGKPVYVTLTSTVNGSTASNSYSFMDGSGSGAAALTSPSNGSTLGATETFTWTMNSATGPVYLHVGSTVGGVDIVNIGPLTGSSVTVNLPTDGNPAYATLTSMINGSIVSNSYSFTDLTRAAELIWPARGSTVGANQTFAWVMNSATVPVYLRAGTSVGGTDIANIGPIPATNATIPLPVNGSPLYVTLWSTENSALVGNYYTFTEETAQPAAFASPTNGSTLQASQTFSWAMNSATWPVTIWVGSTPGGSDIQNVSYSSGSSTTLALPQNGAPLYVTLWSTLNGSLVPNSFTYTAATGASGGTSSPTITSLNPSSGPAGALLTISGTNFGSSQGQVLIDGIVATIVSWNAGSIIAWVPNAAPAGELVPVTVTVNGLTSNAVGFSVIGDGSSSQSCPLTQ